MKRGGPGHEARGAGEAGIPASVGGANVIPGPTRPAPVALSLVCLSLMLWGLAQTDLAVAQFIRAVHLSWLETLGNIGNDLGGGWALVAVSAVLLAGGWLGGRSVLLQAGLQTLVAHALAGLVAQVLKRTVGRPRPRLTHDDAFQFGAAFQSGFESFPSGHATASFAVATVLARRFPRLAGALYAVAAFVACSRVVRGSHFPTDIAVGALLGLTIGLLVSAPWGAGGRVVARGVVWFTLGLAAVFAPLWLALHHPEARLLGDGPAAAGLVLVATGAVLCVVRVVRPDRVPAWLPGLPTGHAVIAVGLGLSTGSALLLLVGGLAGLMLWLDGPRDPGLGPTPADGPIPAPVPSAALELVGIVTAFLAVFLLRAVTGLLPLL